jgi:hypothetical protein
LEDLAASILSLTMEAARSSEMLVFYCNTTQHHHTEHLHMNVYNGSITPITADLDIDFDNKECL